MTPANPEMSQIAVTNSVIATTNSVITDFKPLAISPVISAQIRQIA